MSMSNECFLEIHALEIIQSFKAIKKTSILEEAMDEEAIMSSFSVQKN